MGHFEETTADEAFHVSSWSLEVRERPLKTPRVEIVNVGQVHFSFNARLIAGREFGQVKFRSKFLDFVLQEIPIP